MQELKGDIDLRIADAMVIMSEDKSMFLIRGRVVDTTPTGLVRTDKYAHVTMTSQSAMRLLVMLEDAQRTHALPKPNFQPEQIHVPPAKDRH